MKPTVLRQTNLVQLSYNLPHRIFTTKVYPSKSPNGSSIIIYGHEDGLRILWYGGKSFRPPKAPEQSPKVNGTSKSDQMVIDLDDDEPEPPKQESQNVEFENEEDEVDPLHPYQNVLRFLDVSFGTSVLHIAAPHLPPDIAKAPIDSFPPIFSDQLVLVAGCEDLSIRLITIPLTPPSPLTTDPKNWNLQTIRIAGSSSHKDQITSISVTHTETLDSDADRDRSKSRSRSRTRPTTTAAAVTATKEWSLIIASTSCTGTGLLLIHQIPILKNHILASSPEVMFPIQRQYLSASLFNAVVAFNPSGYPADRHSNVLITIPDAGCVKIYQVFTPHSFQQGRRGSAATTESTTSSLRSNLGSSLRGGRLLVTLYAGFSSAKESEWSPKRKLVLDASWVLGGRAILALLEDGEWGVWDLEAAGPSTASTTQNLVKGQGNVSGIQGGSLTKFAIKGNIGPALETGSKTSTANAPASKTTGLAPLTPHTKKIRSDGLFQYNTPKIPSEHVPGVTPYGSICVTEHPGSVATTTMIQEESVILSFRDTNVFVPSLLAYWRSETKGNGTFDSVNSIRPSLLPMPRLGGEQQHSISEMSQSSTAIRSGLFSATQTTPNLLIATDHRLVMLAPPLPDIVSSDIENATRTLPTRPLNQRTISTDQMLLTQGELDVDGVDRILQGMESSSKVPGTSAFGKSVGFLIDEDNDVEMAMGTPTPKNQQGRGVNRLGPSSTTKPRGRIFS